jgi:hypothetical protein
MPRTTPPTITAAMASTTSHVHLRRLEADRGGVNSAFSAVLMVCSFVNGRFKKYDTKRNVRYG